MVVTGCGEPLMTVTGCGEPLMAVTGCGEPLMTVTGCGEPLILDGTIERKIRAHARAKGWAGLVCQRVYRLV